MAIERSAGAVVYRIDEEGKILFLLLQPSPGKPWGFPKGKLDRGENEQQAAIREIAEESGITDVVFDADFRCVVHYEFRRQRMRVHKSVTYFLARTHTSTIRISSEHVNSRWATYDEAMTLVVYENALAVLGDAYEHLTH